MTAIVVAGFHRSGTSAVARSLAEAGLFLGDDLLGSEPSNPHGHFEDREVVDIHQDLLDVNGVDWKADTAFDPYVPERVWATMSALVRKRIAHHRDWGFKDPRVCLFLPLWRHLIPDVSVLVVFRNPAETVRSLHMRHSRQMAHNRGPGLVHQDFWRDPDLGVKMWLAYHDALFAALPPEDRVHTVSFGDRSAIADIASIVRARWSVELDADHRDVLDPGLGRSDVDPIAVREPELVERVDRTWQRLHEMASRSAARVAAVGAT